MRASTNSRGGRPTIMCTRGVVVSGHYLATEAGMHILRAGGNAFDAAVAVGFALTVLEPHQNGLGGEVPIVLYSASEGGVHTVSGNGIAPAAATIERFRSLGVGDAIPGDGYLPALVPPAPDTWMTMLVRFGTMSLADVLRPALELAERGFPMHDSLHDQIAAHVGRFTTQWPTSAHKFLRAGAAPAVGTVWRQPALAGTFRKLIEAESGAPDREAGLKAARDRFYKGDIAADIVAFATSTPCMDATGREHTALLTVEDFAAYEARVEPAVSADYKGYQVHKCSGWTQGPVLCQSLRLVEGFPLAEMGHNSPRLHPHAGRVHEAGLRRPRVLLRRPALLRRPVRAVAGRRVRGGAASARRPGARQQGAAAGRPRAVPRGRHCGRGSGLRLARRRRHDEAGGRRLRRQHGLLHAERRLADVLAGRGGRRIPARDARTDVLPGRGPPERAAAGQAPARDADARPWSRARAGRGWRSAARAATARTSGACSSS